MRLSEETISSQIIYEGRIIKLRKDLVRLPDGRESTREVVIHRGAVAAVPLLEDGSVVMVKQFRQAAGQELLEIPAGMLEAGEDPEACAQRELQEETGYRPGKLRLLFSSYLAPGYSSEILHTYLAQDLIVSQTENDEDEFIEIVKVPFADAIELIRNGQIKDAKTICGLLMTEKIIK